MARIVYLLLSNGGVAGGQKIAVRQVEALQTLGLEATCRLGEGSAPPAWFDYDAGVLSRGLVPTDEILVLPDDAVDALQLAARQPNRLVVLCQNPYHMAASGAVEVLARHPDRFRELIAVAPRQAELLRRLFPHATVHLVRPFADERLFRPAAKEPVGAFTPRKRAVEAAAIRRLHRLFYPGREFGWLRLEGASERQVADVFGRASVHLSLSRLESVGMTTLEAMASGCVCAGFTGIGGGEYATPENGFWVADDDCVAAADALEAAIDLSLTGGPRHRAMVEAGQETARAWSHAAFRGELEAAWREIAPEAWPA